MHLLSVNQPSTSHRRRPRTLPTPPRQFDYPAMRRASVRIPSRIARDPHITVTGLRVLIELASAGADSDWIILPTRYQLADATHLHYSGIGRAVDALVEAGYLEMRREHQHLRYVRLVLSAHEFE